MAQLIAMGMKWAKEMSDTSHNVYSSDLLIIYHEAFKVAGNSNACKRFHTGALEEQATFPEAVIGLNAIVINSSPLSSTTLLDLDCLPGGLSCFSSWRG